MDITKINYELSTKDVNLYGDLKTSAMFTMMQDAAVKSSNLMGAGYHAMLEKNLIWVVALQKAEIIKLPKWGDSITLESWPGKPMHSLMPRYYRFLDSEGETIINCSSLWSLVDIDDRRMIKPDERGLEFPYIVTGYEISRPRSPKGSADIHGGEFTVPYSFLDLNGHMNNCRYFDVCEDVLPAAQSGNKLKSVTAEYSSEIKLGETISLDRAEKDGKHLVIGTTDRPCFKVLFEYE